MADVPVQMLLGRTTGQTHARKEDTIRIVDRSTDVAAAEFRLRRIGFWDGVADRGAPHDQSGYYHDRLAQIYGFVIPPGKRVLEIGCGKGDLLASLRPARGVGVDFSPHMVSRAGERHPSMDFVEMDALELDIDETFDYVILSDLVNDLWDVQAVFERILTVCAPSTRVVLNFYNRVWQPPLGLARRLGFAKPTLLESWLSRRDVENLLQLSGYDIVTDFDEILAPLSLGPISSILNRYIVKFWPFDRAALTGFIIARPTMTALGKVIEEASVSIVVPARNESGNIESILERTPQMGTWTELIFVEGNSTDDTYERIERALDEEGREDVLLLRQPGVGKGDAVRFGFDHASGDILMILDADMTVAPEELPRFYRAIVEGTAEFVNGVRLVYPMEGQAMRTLNYIGNKAFSVAFSWLLRQPVKDTLCGTKVLSRESYDVIASSRAYFGDFDPFGDFDLLFGASRNNLKIIDLPIRYRDRTYGDTNIDRWSHGVLLLRMVMFAARKLRFV